MGFSAIKGQESALGYLQIALNRERIPSAYIFQGAHNTGKRTTALQLAKALNCHKTRKTETGDNPTVWDACDACPSCRKIDEEMHPDVETVSPDGQFIKIDQIRAIGDKLSLIPFEARKRVVVLAQAERMNAQAANAFLKTLEEPPANTLIVLCVEDPSRLPETIVSRCVPVRFGLLDRTIVEELLSAGADWEPEIRSFAVRFAKGTLRPALKDKAPQWLKVRDEMMRLMAGLHKPIFPQATEHFSRWGSGQGDWDFVLEWLETWFRDVALVQEEKRLAGGRERSSAEGLFRDRLLNGDRLPELMDFADKMAFHRLEACYLRVLETREAIITWNANKTLALEALWLGFRRAA